MTQRGVYLRWSASCILGVDMGLPGAVLFCCDHNAVRSPMAEGLMKMLYGTETYVQSAGVLSDKDTDGFAIAVCKELGVELSNHRVRSFEEMENGGEDLESFDVIVALSTTSAERARSLTKGSGVEVLFWPIGDPTAVGETREQRLWAYREIRDDIIARIKENFAEDM